MAQVLADEAQPAVADQTYQLVVVLERQLNSRPHNRRDDPGLVEGRKQ